MNHGYRTPVAALAAALLIALAPMFAVAADVATPANPLANPINAVNTARGTALATEVMAVAIIESQSENVGHDMDAEWQAVATGMGHTVTMLTQSALDALANLDGQDILIVSSGVIDLPANRVQTIADFTMSGRAVYLQGEFICTYSANLAFGTIVGDLGGSYSPAGTTSGLLEPMLVLGELATEPNSVPSFDGFWYGCAGTGDATLEPFLQYLDQSFGFIFTPPTPAYGPIIYTTDQDWIREADFRLTSVDLMENILTYLGAHSSVAVESTTWSDVRSLYR